jgi:DNA-binding NarL/FixJ family response regulator
VGERGQLSVCGLILVIDHDLVTCGLVASLSSRMGFATRSAWDGEQALECLREARPDLAIVEVELPGLNGLVVLRELHAAFGDELPVILTTAEHATPHDRTAGILLGADDYLVKPLDPAEFEARVRRSLRRSGSRVRNGTENGSHGGDAKLSPREREILVLLADGKTQAQIASQLFISPKTVATHIQHLLSKLGVNSRAQAVALAYRLGLVSSDVQAHALESVATDPESQTPSSLTLSTTRAGATRAPSRFSLAPTGGS